MPAPLRRTYLPEDLHLRPATRADDAFLYRLLEERYRAPAANISGMSRDRLPSFEEHVAHLDREPYQRMEIVEIEGAAVGFLYLSWARVCGCFVLRDYTSRGVGLAACQRFFQTGPYPIVAHLNPLNRASLRTAERLGFVLKQATPQRLTLELAAAPRRPLRRPTPVARAPHGLALSVSRTSPRPLRPEPRPRARATSRRAP